MILDSEEAEDITDGKEYDIFEAFAEHDEFIVRGKYLIPKYIIETATTPLILMLITEEVFGAQRVRIIVMCDDGIKLNIASTNNNTPPDIKIYKDEELWQKDLELLASILYEEK